MGDTIVNGYIIMWFIALIFSYVPIGFLCIELTSDYDSPTGSKRKLLKWALIINIIIVALCIATLPVQIALMKELWRG